MKLHLVSGFLGSGKTTAISLGCNELMRNGFKVGVITNDQGINLVDSGFFRSLSIPNRQVINGCFCCNYDQLDQSLQSLIDSERPGIIFAESVGSCTDIVATVLNPLSHFHHEFEITVSAFADSRLLLRLLRGDFKLFDEEVNYIYNKQLEEAGVMIINKVDLLEENDLKELKQLAGERFRDKILLYQNSLNRASIGQWLEELDNPQPTQSNSPLEINYDTYGSGEAKLAWVDQEILIESAANNAIEEALGLISQIHARIKENNFVVGHLKFLLDGETKLSYTSSGEADTGIVGNKKALFATLLINARVQTEPGALAGLIEDSIKEIESSTGCKIITREISAFQPGYPSPTHRMAEPFINSQAGGG